MFQDGETGPGCLKPNRNWLSSKYPGWIHMFKWYYDQYAHGEKQIHYKWWKFMGIIGQYATRQCLKLIKSYMIFFGNNWNLRLEILSFVSLHKPDVLYFGFQLQNAAKWLKHCLSQGAVCYFLYHSSRPMFNLWERYMYSSLGLSLLHHTICVNHRLLYWKYLQC